MKRLQLFGLCIIGAAIVSLGAGCNTSTTNSPGPTPTPSFKHMYLSIFAVAGGVQIYSLPLSGTSTPTGTISGLNDPAEIFVDKAGRLFVPLNSVPTVDVYTPPISAASTPAFALTTAHTDTESVTEDSTGTIYVGVLNSATCCIDVFNGPVTAAATDSYEITANAVVNGLGYPYGMGFDSSGNLYVSSTTSTLKFVPPFSAASVPTAVVLPNQDNYGLLVDASNRVFVANATVDGTIDVFNQPFVSGTGTRAFGLLVTAATYVQGTAFDAAGNLWAVSSTGGVYEIPAPISATSTATLVFTVANAYGIAFGP